MAESSNDKLQAILARKQQNDAAEKAAADREADRNRQIAERLQVTRSKWNAEALPAIKQAVTNFNAEVSSNGIEINYHFDKADPKTQDIEIATMNFRLSLNGKPTKQHFTFRVDRSGSIYVESFLPSTGPRRNFHVDDLKQDAVRDWFVDFLGAAISENKR